MFLLSDECVVCRREHLTPHELGCLTDPNRPSGIREAGAPNADTWRWWLPVEESAGLDHGLLTEAMRGIRWRSFDGIADSQITFLSIPLQSRGWVLASYARQSQKPRAAVRRVRHPARPPLFPAVKDVLDRRARIG